MNVGVTYATRNHIDQHLSWSWIWNWNFSNRQRFAEFINKSRFHRFCHGMSPWSQLAGPLSVRRTPNEFEFCDCLSAELKRLRGHPGAIIAISMRSVCDLTHRLTCAVAHTVAACERLRYSRRAMRLF